MNKYYYAAFFAVLYPQVAFPVSCVQDGFTLASGGVNCYQPVKFNDKFNCPVTGTSAGDPLPGGASSYDAAYSACSSYMETAFVIPGCPGASTATTSDWYGDLGRWVDSSNGIWQRSQGQRNFLSTSSSKINDKCVGPVEKTWGMRWTEYYRCPSQASKYGERYKNNIYLGPACYNPT